MKWTKDRETWHRGFAWLPHRISNKEEIYIWLEYYEYRYPRAGSIEIREIGAEESSLWRTTGL